MHRVGTVGIIRQMARTNAGLQIIVEGLQRAHADVVNRTGETMSANISPQPEKVTKSIEVDAYVRRIQEQVDRALSLTSSLSQELRGVVSNLDDPLRLAYLLASLLDLPAAEKQGILEAEPLLAKLEAVSGALSREIELLEMKGKIESQAQQEMSDAQRQYYLRQQLKAIQEQLGEGEADEIKLLREKVAAANLPEQPLQAATRELDRLARMNSASPDHQMTRTYLEWLLDIPWSVASDDRLDPVEARRVLDEDHYDLDKIKERIVEYLAVRKLKGDMKGPILCFVGPPGVGKTSLGQSIARAMNRKFVRLSLGGVRDEAEIRGHRRTYIGALPGRIVQSMRQAGTINPVFMLDEMDKIGVGFQGDPAAALLEVLDPAQNHSFRDHYLEVPLDLSRVLFIATANQLGTLHPALLDRMEILQLPGYTEDEKRHIARTLSDSAAARRAWPAVERDGNYGRSARRDHLPVHARGRRAQPGAADWRGGAENRGPSGEPPRDGQRRASRDHSCRCRRSQGIPWAAAFPAGLGVQDVAAGRRDRRRLDRGRWRCAVHRSVFAPGRQSEHHPDRPAGCGYAGIGPRRRQPHSRQRRGTGRAGRFFREERPARARPGRSHPEGRPLCGGDDGDRDLVGDPQSADARRRGDDRRNHALGSGAAGRWHPREGPGGAAARHSHVHPAGAERRRSRGASGGSQREYDLRSGPDARRSAQSRLLT